MTSSQIEERLRQLDIELPRPASPAGAYVAWVLTDPLLFVAGQLPMWNGEIRFLGRIDSELSKLALQVDGRVSGSAEPLLPTDKDFYVEPQKSASCARHAINAIAFAASRVAWSRG